jgi:N-acyl-phosphatidylethanolamine-hydrolysing phospholipase D
MGPKRYTQPPCNIADIPVIDAVVISHNHYDHLSHPTVTEIARRHPNAHFFVPLGNKAWFEKCNISQCTELDWWDEINFTLTPQTSYSDDPKSSTKPSITSTSTTTSTTSPSTITATISCLPCQHISARTPFDKAHTLWASWAITSPTSPTSSPSPSASVYFAGDTGYRSVPPSSDGHDDWSPQYSHLPHCPAFADIGKLRGPFDLGLIPIGAYMPRYIMSPMHANPRDAVEIFRDTRCKKGLGMHWGTWVLTEEDVLEPPKLLKEALHHHKMDEAVFGVCDIGESREFDVGGKE